MNVYCDPQFPTTADLLIAQLTSRGVPTNMDEAREQLIAAGELEQALSDSFDEWRLLCVAQRMTDARAEIPPQLARRYLPSLLLHWRKGTG